MENLTNNISDEYFMQQALLQAQRAAECGEVPVGAVLVKDNCIIATGFNQPIQLHDPSAHAEMQVLRKAGQTLQNYRLLDTTLYVTLEPCAMCVGAMIHARVKRLVFGAADSKSGACGGALNILHDKAFNHRLEISPGILTEECGKILKEFFAIRRKSGSI